MCNKIMHDIIGDIYRLIASVAALDKTDCDPTRM